jgi:hypothetical protein
MKILRNRISIELVFRQCVFIILNIYAIRKLFGGQFYMYGELPADVANMRLGEVDSFSLAWTFMGYSYIYILFIGLSQLIGAWLLLWNKTKLIGTLILIPIMINIVMFDLIFLSIYSALAIAVIILLMLLWILHFNKDKIIAASQALMYFEPIAGVAEKKKAITTGATFITLLLIFGFLYFIERNNI